MKFPTTGVLGEIPTSTQNLVAPPMPPTGSGSGGREGAVLGHSEHVGKHGGAEGAHDKKAPLRNICFHLKQRPATNSQPGQIGVRAL